MSDEPNNARSTPGDGQVCAIFSPRGGAGTTTLAVNLAARHAVEQPRQTALFDLKLTFGDTLALLGLEPLTSLAAIRLEDSYRWTLERYLVDHSTGLRVLAAITRPEEGELVTAAHVRGALCALKSVFSATFVDCDGTFDAPTIAALEMADTVVVVCTPELNTMRDVRECQRVFGEVMRLDMKRMCFVLNHNQPFAVLSRKQFESALEQQMHFELPHAGKSAYKAAMGGQPLVLTDSRSSYSKAVERLRRSLVVPAGRQVARHA
jgi:pilus assembly protein CpaE